MECTENIGTNGFQNTHNGKSDIFLAKIDSSGQRLWGTYFGSPLEEFQKGNVGRHLDH